MFKRLVLATMLVAVTTPALAHTGHHSFLGFLAGFAHPLTGLDHTLALVGVGLFASLPGGRALWAVPASFIVMMLVGGMMGFAGIGIPAVEIGIAVSVVVIGVVVFLGRSWPIGAAMALVGVFAILHGYAHGVEIPVGASAALYSLGFALASTMLHVTGIALGSFSLHQMSANRLGGAAVAVTGVLLFFV
jgi:urease accessory protein